MALPGESTRPCQLNFLELNVNMPFDVRRVYWIHSLSDGEWRGRHAHRKTEQMLIAAGGSFDVRLDDGYSTEEYHLQDPLHALCIPGGLWRDIRVRASQSVLLVLASTLYDEADYIREYEEFLQFARSRPPHATGDGL